MPTASPKSRVAGMTGGRDRLQRVERPLATGSVVDPAAKAQCLSISPNMGRGRNAPQIYCSPLVGPTGSEKHLANALAVFIFFVVATQLVFGSERSGAIAVLIAGAGALSLKRIYEEGWRTTHGESLRVASAVHLVAAVALLLKAPFPVNSVTRPGSLLASFGFVDVATASALIGAGYLAFDLASRKGILRPRRSRGGRRAVLGRTMATRLWPLSHVRMATVLLLIGRMVLQLRYGFAQAGSVPLLPGSGIVFFAITNGLLVCLTALIAMEFAHHRPLHKRASIPLSFGYVALGVVGGVRATPVQLVIVWLIVGSCFGKFVRGRAGVLAAVALLTALSSFGIITATFRAPEALPSIDSSFAAGINRVSVLEPIAQVVHVNAHASPKDVLFSYNEFVNTQIYGLPFGVKTGFAVSIWGFGYIVGGATGGLLAGLALGIIVRLIDLVTYMFDTPAMRSVWISMMWLWVASLTIEGTIWFNMKSLAVTLLALAIVGRPRWGRLLARA